MKRILLAAGIAAALGCQLPAGADEPAPSADAATQQPAPSGADRLFAAWDATRRSSPATAYSAAKEMLERFPQDAHAGAVRPWVLAYEKVVAQAATRAESALSGTTVATDGTRFRGPAARVANCRLHVEYAYDSTPKYSTIDIDLRKVDPRAVVPADNNFWKRVQLTSRRYEPSCEATDHAKAGTTEAPAPGDKLASAKHMSCALIVREDSAAAAAALRTAVEACQPQAVAGDPAEAPTPEQAKERIVGLLTPEASFPIDLMQTIHIAGESLRFEGCTFKARFKTRLTGLVRNRLDLIDYVIPFDLVDPASVRALERNGKKMAMFSSIDGSKVMQQDMSYNAGSYERPAQGETWSKDFGASPEMVVDSMDAASRLAEALFYLAKACNVTRQAAK